MQNQLERKIQELEGCLDQQQKESQRESQQISQLNQRVKEYENIIHNRENELWELKETNATLSFEFNSLKSVFQQVQEDVDELLQRKGLTQNKLALSYGFIHHLYQLMLYLMNEVKLQKLLMRGMTNFIAYYLNIRNQIQKEVNPGNNKIIIYRRFRKIKNVCIFVRRIKQSQQKNLQHQSYIYSKFGQYQITFDQNDEIDTLFEQYIPLYHQNSSQQSQKQVSIDQQISQELFGAILKLFKFNQYQMVLKKSPCESITRKSYEDLKYIQHQIGQMNFYQHELALLQERVLHLDTYINQLHNEMKNKEDIQQSNQKVQIEEKENKHVQPFSTPVEFNKAGRYDDITPPQFLNRNLQKNEAEMHSVSKTLQSELMQIIKRKNTIHEDQQRLLSDRSMLFNYSGEKKPGKILRKSNQ